MFKYCWFAGLKLEGERRADSIEAKRMFMSVVQSCSGRLGPHLPACMGSMQRYVYDQLQLDFLFCEADKSWNICAENCVTLQRWIRWPKYDTLAIFTQSRNIISMTSRDYIINLSYQECCKILRSFIESISFISQGKKTEKSQCVFFKPHSHRGGFSLLYSLASRLCQSFRYQNVEPFCFNAIIVITVVKYLFNSFFP